MLVPSMNVPMNKSIAQCELGDNSDSSQRLEMTRKPIPPCGSQVVLGKRMRLSSEDPTISISSEDPTISKSLLQETINWTLQPLEPKVDLTTILNHQREAPQKSSSGGGGGGGPKIFLAPPEDESCHEDRRLII